jgi:hypothetical protein
VSTLLTYVLINVQWWPNTHLHNMKVEWYSSHSRLLPRHSRLLPRSFAPFASARAGDPSLCSLSPPEMSPRTPIRPIATSNYRLLKTVLTEIKDLKEALPSMIAEQLHRKDNSRKLVVYGIPEDTARDQVSKLFSLVGVPCDAVLPLSHLGKPRNDGLPRPLCVEISQSTIFPHLITLSSRLRSIAAYKHCSVRRLETPEQRREGFLLREARRNAATAPISTPTATLSVPSTPVPATTPVTISVDEPVEVPRNDSPASSLLAMLTPQQKTEYDFIQNCCNKLYNMYDDVLPMSDRYEQFRSYETSHPLLSQTLSDVYFNVYGFRFHLRPIGNNQ